MQINKGLMEEQNSAKPGLKMCIFTNSIFCFVYRQSFDMKFAAQFLNKALVLICNMTGAFNEDFLLILCGTPPHGR